MRQFQIELTIIYLYKIPANVILIHSLSDDFDKYWWFFKPYESCRIPLDFSRDAPVTLLCLTHISFLKVLCCIPGEINCLQGKGKTLYYLVNPQQKGSLSNRNYKKLPI